MELEKITFKLLAIEIPTGTGRVNIITTADSKRCIVVALAVKNKEMFQTTLQNKQTGEESQEINKG